LINQKIIKMKKVLFLFSVLVASLVFVACDDDDDLTVTTAELPEKAQAFMQTHFEGQEIRTIRKDNDSYDVYLANGFEVEFDLSGEWDDIDGNVQKLPQSIIDLLPEGIPLYVTENYPQNHISEINKERYGFEIGLNGGLDLKFDKDGGFLGIDK